MAEAQEQKVAIALTSEEALVLFELLARFSETEELTVADQAERQVLWNVACLLERELVEPFQANYRELLEAAKKKLKE